MVEKTFFMCCGGLVTQKRDTVHVACIKKYCGNLDGTNIPEAVLDLVDRTTAKYGVVESIVDIVKNDQGLWLCLQWEGLPDKRDSTWNVISELNEAIPDMITSFLKAAQNKDESDFAVQELDFS